RTVRVSTDIDHRIDELLPGGLADYSICLKMATNSPALGMIDELSQSASDPRLLETDRQVQSLCEIYNDANDSERIRIRQRFRGKMSFSHFASRMAIKVLRGGPCNYITDGLVALCIEDFAFDPRDSLMSLAALQHAARTTGLDFPIAVAAAMDLSSESVKSQLSWFVKRGPENTKLGDFALREYHDSNGAMIGFA
ncbi:MAG TPA: hypothetical protein VFV87_21380, partial [Pirellulaceae bacterium]|nr:hypothetical protein [Pirellulaceae bacterium]